MFVIEVQVTVVNKCLIVLIFYLNNKKLSNNVIYIYLICCEKHYFFNQKTLFMRVLFTVGKKKNCGSLKTLKF